MADGIANLNRRDLFLRVMSLLAMRETIGGEARSNVASASPAHGDLVTDESARFRIRSQDVVDATDYPSLQVAINDAEARGIGTVRVSGEAYPLPSWDGVSPQLVLVQRPIVIEGTGQGMTRLVVPANTPTSIDAIRYHPSATGGHAGFGLRDLTIATASPGVAARHVLNLDITGGGRYISRVDLERVTMESTGGWNFVTTAGTYAAPLNRPTIFLVSLRECTFNGGLDFTAAADSILLEHCTITGKNGLAVELIAGAALFTIFACNITATAGIVVKSCHHFTMTHTYVESLLATTLTVANNALVDLTGATDQLYHPVIKNNTINALHPSVECVRLDNVKAADVDDNDLATTAGVPAIRVTSNALDTIIGEGNTQYGAGTLLADAGVRTVHRPTRSPVQQVNLSDSSVIAGTVSETRFDRTLTIPGGTLRVGDVVEFVVSGNYTTAAGAIVLIYRTYLGAPDGGTQLGASGLTHPGSTINGDWTISGRFSVRTTGPSGTVQMGPLLIAIEGATAETPMTNVPATTVALDTTADRNVEFSVAMASARAGDTIKLSYAQLDIQHPQRAA